MYIFQKVCTQIINKKVFHGCQVRKVKVEKLSVYIIKLILHLYYLPKWYVIMDALLASWHIGHSDLILICYSRAGSHAVYLTNLYFHRYTYRTTGVSSRCATTPTDDKPDTEVS